MLSFYSTNRCAPEVDLAAALLSGQAADRGLYMPRPLPVMSPELLARARDLSYADLAAAILRPYAEGVFTPEALSEI